MICKNFVVGIFPGPQALTNVYHNNFLRCNIVEMITIEGVNLLAKGPNVAFEQNYEEATITMNTGNFVLGENVILWMTPLTA